MGSKTKLVTTSIKDNEVKEDNLNTGAVTTAKFASDSVESSEINDGTVTADDLASTLDLSSKTLTLPITALNSQHFNISLLGFKLAVNENLTIFNLVDGVVDEFHDESGTDEAEGSNDLYNATDDYYINSTQPDGLSVPYSGAYTTTSMTEPDTGTTGTNPAIESGTFGTYVVPTGVTSIDIKVWGAGGGGSPAESYYPGQPAKWDGGGGGYAEGTLAVTGGQTLYVAAGEGGEAGPGSEPGYFNSGNGRGEGGGGGGLAGVFGANIGTLNPYHADPSNPTVSAPQAFVVAGSGGGAGACGHGGAGGGLTGDAGGGTTEQTDGGSSSASSGGGGDQEQGGQGGAGNPSSYNALPGHLFTGGSAAHPTPSAGLGGGGNGFYGGGGGAYRIPGQNLSLSGGGGSSYYGHPQVTSGSTEEGALVEGGGTAICGYSSGTNEGGPQSVSGEDGYVLITACKSATTTTTFIASEPFAAGSVPTTSRIVIFEEDVASPTLNTDIIASISRDGGSNFTTATLSDSGYVTGSSGQRILTGQATISGQPSGQSMRWKLALANNQVKIHGVSLSWA